MLHDLIRVNNTLTDCYSFFLFTPAPNSSYLETYICIVVFRDYSRNIGNSPFNATKGSKTAPTGRGSNPRYESVPIEPPSSVNISHPAQSVLGLVLHTAFRNRYSASQLKMSKFL